MQALMKLAFLADNWCGFRTFESLYIGNTFRGEAVKAQDNSRFMDLPTEIRLMIYQFVFSPLSLRSANPLYILSTCRQIHGEAIVTALRATHFYINRFTGLNFNPRLRSLGKLQQHLRHI